MSDEGKVRVVVRSRRVPVRTVTVTGRPIVPIGAVSSPSGSLPYSSPQSERGVVFESVLNDGHLRAIDEGQRLARSLGLELEVVDSGKRGLLGRVLTSLGLEVRRPTIMVAPSIEGDCAEFSPPLVPAR